MKPAPEKIKYVCTLIYLYYKTQFLHQSTGKT